VVVVAEREGEVWRRVYLRGVRGECGPGLAARGRWESEEVLARKKQSCLDPGSGCEGAGDEHEGKRRREEQDRTEQSRGFLFFSFLLFFSSLGKRRCLHNVSGALLARISDQRTPRLGSTTSTDEPTESRMWMTQRGLRSASGGMRVQRSAIPCGTTDGRARATRCCTRPSEQDSRLLALWTVLGVSLLSTWLVSFAVFIRQRRPRLPRLSSPRSPENAGNIANCRTPCAVARLLYASPRRRRSGNATS